MQKDNFDLDKIIYDLDSYKKNSYLTHNIHPYPAKFIPKIPGLLIQSLSKQDEVILDPFCGSGTTILEARIFNRNAIGIDINPIACLISKVKTTILSLEEIRLIFDTLELIENDFRQNIEYNIPSFHNIDFWFNNNVQRELAIIKGNIEKINLENVNNFLRVGLSSIIVKVSNQESDTRYASVDKNISDHFTIETYRKKIIEMIKRIQDLSVTINRINYSIIYQEDSTNFDFWNGHKIDLVITSPPYMNSYDYYLYHKHRMSWLGIDHKPIQEKEFGSRNKHNDKNFGVEHYLDNMIQNISEVKKILKAGRYYCIIVGDAIVKGKFYKMNVEFDKIFNFAGYSKRKEIKFDQRKYTRTFTPGIKSIYKESYILIYQN